MSLNKFIYIFFLVLATNLVNGQKLTILDQENNKAVSNVFVYNDEQTKVKVSDAYGQVNLSSFKDDEEIIIEHVSYQFVYHKKSILKKHNYKVYLVKTSDLLPEVVLSVSNKKTDMSRVSEKISVLTASKIKSINAQTTPDLLSRTPGITVQKSQMGGGSPTIRGFEANRVLLVVDGIRMNNAIYRSGHLQNSLTIDQGNLERTEIIYGPSSIKYGSDALGGVVHFYTKRPQLGEEKWDANSIATFSTANNGLQLHGDASYANENFASYTSISYGNYGDLMMGKIRNHGFNEWGKVKLYSPNTKHYYSDTPRENDNPHLQRNTSYSQIDFLQKFISKLDENNELEFNFQYSSSSDIPRFDALTDMKGDGLKWAEWYYGPQNRLLASVYLKSEYDRKWLKKGSISFAYQNLQESRMQRKFGSLDKSFRKEHVNVFSINADFATDFNKYILSYGSELTYNQVGSKAEGKELIVQGSEVIGLGDSFAVQSRYPDGGSNYSNIAFYTDVRKLISEKSTINLGLRWTSTFMNAKWEDQTFITLPKQEIFLNNNAITATLGFTHQHDNSWRFKGHVSTGFRSPNIDDVGKVREKSGLVTVPNIDLKPEYVINFEVGLEKFFRDGNVVLGADIYYTRIFDYIMRHPYQLEEGRDSILYDGNMYPTIANVNSGQAYVFGGNLSLSAKISSKITVESFLTYTKGLTVDENLPMPSIAPLFGSTSLNYKHKKWALNINSVYNGRKKAEDFDVYGGVDNLDKAASETYGTPSWYTLNASVNYTFSSYLNFQLGIDNILDHHYLTFASGISSPGRNFIFTARASI